MLTLRYWRVAHSRTRRASPQMRATLCSCTVRIGDDNQQQRQRAAGQRGAVRRSKSLAAVCTFSFPRCWRAKDCKRETVKSPVSGAACNARPDLRTFNQTFSLKFWHLVVLTPNRLKLRPPPTVLISLCVVPNQTAIVAFKYIQMPRFFFPNNVSNQCRCESAFS